MLDGNTAARHAYERECLQTSQEREIRHEEGVQEAFGHEAAIRALIASAGEYERLRESLQMKSKTFGSMLDGMNAWDLSGDPEREFQAFIEAYGDRYAD